MKNLSLKIWSLLIAIFIAYIVRGQTNASVIPIIVPLEVLNLPAEKTILHPRLAQARVTVRGPSHLVSGVAASPPSFKIRMPEEVGSRHQVTLQASNLPLPHAVEIISIDPPEVSFILDDLIERDIPIVVPRIGKVNNTHKLTSLEIEPQTVKLIGPGTLLKDLKIIETTPLDLRGIKSNENFTLALRLPGSDIKASVSEVKAAVFITSLSIDRKLRNIKIEIRSATPGGVKPTPETVDVVISGTKSVLQRIKRAQVIPYVRYDGIIPEINEAKVLVEVPEGVTIEEVVPAVVGLVLTNNGTPSSLKPNNEAKNK